MRWKCSNAWSRHLLIGRELNQKVGERKSEERMVWCSVLRVQSTFFLGKKSRKLLFFNFFHIFLEKNKQIFNFIVSFSGKYVIIGLSEEKSLERFRFYRIFVWSNSF